MPPLPTLSPDLQRAAVVHEGLPRGVRRAVEYIDRHLCEPVSVAELAQAACLSRYHLARLFRASVGTSPTGYLRQRRIERAQALLRDGEHKVSEIANALCFADQSHFVRSFRQITGQTPRRYADAHAVHRC